MLNPRNLVPKSWRPYAQYQSLSESLLKQEKVMDGPFRGMRVNFAGMGDSSVTSILGTLEYELHPSIELLIKQDFSLLINIGAYSGYYANGFLYRCPKLRAIAYEMDTTLHPKIRQIAELNQVDSRLEIRGYCDLENLQADLEHPDTKTLVVMDVEGFENVLLDPVAIPGLRQASVLVELHEFAVAGIGKTIRSRFESTHTITQIDSVPRTNEDMPNLSRFMHWYLRDYLYLLTNERPCQMQWFIMEPKG